MNKSIYLKTILLTFFLSLIYVLSANAQNGIIRGTLFDHSTGETVPFANVMIAGTTTGTTTDLDGKYNLSLEPGQYAIEFSYLGFNTLTINEITVTAGDVTVVDAKLESGATEIAEVVVRAKVSRSSESAVLTLQKKSPNLLDGISSQTFSKSGDGNAAAAIKRVTGVSVEGNKYVYVRGLGDRYSKTILNGMDIPSLDPNKNAVQMDIFPSNLIDNIIIYKTFTPNLPGDFSGGLVDISTKDFPEQKTSKLSISGSYNPNMNLKDNFISYEGGKTDFLGFDDGTRELPINQNLNIPRPVLNPSLSTSVTKSFNPNLAAQRTMSPLNFKVNYSLGNQLNGAHVDWGYNIALNYANSYQFNDQIEYAEYEKNSDRSKNELFRRYVNIGELGVHDVMWSGLAAIAMKTERSKIALSFIRSQNGVSTAGIFTKNEVEDNPGTTISHNLEYAQRSLNNALLQGKHSIGLKGSEINWKVSGTLSKIDEPDIRNTVYVVENDKLFIKPSSGNYPSRTWRNLDEMGLSGKVDFKKSFQVLNDRSLKLKGGLLYGYKSRDYDILDYAIITGIGNERTGDPNELLLEENLYTTENRNGSYIVGQKEAANAYSARQNVLAGYVMNELKITDRLNSIYGVRVEKTDLFMTGQNQRGDKVLKDEQIFNELDVLPSLNLVYSLSEKSNLRVSYNRTLARPSFVEKSYVQIFDKISQRFFLGNIDLKKTSINNYDLRLEKFLPGQQMVSISGFYKQFKNPIEIVVYDESSPDNFQPKNVDEAQVYGIEIETRKKLDFLNIPQLTVGANVSIIKSVVSLDKSERGEYQSKVDYAREGEVIEDTRALAGQSPYIVNGRMQYTTKNRQFDATLAYNVQGKRLAVVGIGAFADVYEKPFHSLNFNIGFKLSENSPVSFSASANNILNQQREKFYESYGAANRSFELRHPGQTFGFGISWKIK